MKTLRFTTTTIDEQSNACKGRRWLAKRALVVREDVSLFDEPFSRMLVTALQNDGGDLSQIGVGVVAADLGSTRPGVGQRPRVGTKFRRSKQDEHPGRVVVAFLFGLARVVRKAVHDAPTPPQSPARDRISLVRPEQGRRPIIARGL